MKTSDFFYDLPEELIAQVPVEPRESSRMMVVGKETGEITHKYFYNIEEYLDENTVLVLNRSKVIPARLYGRRPEKDEVLEILLLKKLNLSSYECLVKPGKKFKKGTIVEFSDNLVGEVLDVTENGERIISFEVKDKTLLENEFARIGEMPLPPYIHEKLKDKARYNTVYANEEGSSAAPTAGLHFTRQTFDALRKKGVQIEEVILHVGLGTFRPVKVEDVTNHVMHSEEYFLDEETAQRLNEAKKKGNRIVAVGTTSVRVLETLAKDDGTIVAGHGETNIFIYPPYKFKFVDALLTNFHLPESTLLMLVSAFSTKENIMNAYKTAIANRYRFFSFGDCMLIV